MFMGPKMEDCLPLEMNIGRIGQLVSEKSLNKHKKNCFFYKKLLKIPITFRIFESYSPNCNISCAKICSFIKTKIHSIYCTCYRNIGVQILQKFAILNLQKFI